MEASKNCYSKDINNKGGEIVLFDHFFQLNTRLNIFRSKTLQLDKLVNSNECSILQFQPQIESAKHSTKRNDYDQGYIEHIFPGVT